MNKKLVGLLLLCAAFTGCSQAQEVKDQVQNAPSDFWTSLHMVLAFVIDTVFNVALNWVRGALGL